MTYCQDAQASAAAKSVLDSQSKRFMRVCLASPAPHEEKRHYNGRHIDTCRHFLLYSCAVQYIPVPGNHKPGESKCECRDLSRNEDASSGKGAESNSKHFGA